VVCDVLPDVVCTCAVRAALSCVLRCPGKSIGGLIRAGFLLRVARGVGIVVVCSGVQ